MKTTKNSMLLIGAAILACILLLTVVIGGILVSQYNGAATLKNQYEMKVKDNSSEMDNMWKKISQVCQLPEAKKNAFKEIFTSYAQARTPEDGGKMMLWIKESAPNLDLNIYDNAQNIIVSSRDSWTMRQKELVGVAEEFNRRLSVFPGNVVLGMFGFQKIDPKVITSTRTEKAFETGKDDDTDLFNK
jgi:hypothetical protein